MVAFELSLLIKPLQRGKLISIVKKSAEMIISRKGYIEKIEFLGTSTLPYRISTHNKSHSRASYFVIHYHAPYEAYTEIQDECRRDLNVIRPAIIPKKIPTSFQCSLNEELKSPAYRASVKLMTEEGDMRIPKNIRKRNKITEFVKKMPF